MNYVLHVNYIRCIKRMEPAVFCETSKYYLRVQPDKLISKFSGQNIENIAMDGS